MFSSWTDYTTAIPCITIYINCDTCLAINLRALTLTDSDEFIFTLKNYDYTESDFIYIFKARNADMNENGEVLFKIPAKTSKALKPGAFYTFAVLADAYNKKSSTIYKRLAESGKVLLEYGTQDMLVKTGENQEYLENVMAAKLVAPEVVPSQIESSKPGTLLSGRLEIIEEA